MKMPKFKSESEEADWWYANRKQVERELRAVERSGKGKSAPQIVAEEIAKEKQMKLISIRLSEADLARAKRRAETKGIGYQTLIRMLLHEALQKAG